MKRPALSPRRPSNSGTGEGGFTFVEIMLALAVGAIVIVGMYQAFNTLHKWWIAAGIRSDMRQNARAGLETLTRDLEMAGYQTSKYDDVNKIGLAITLASTSEIEMDQQRLDSAASTPANPVYAPRLVYYHLATDMRSGRQNLYRQIRTQPGLPSPDEIVAENVAVFTLGYLDKDNRKFKDPGDPVDPANLPNPPYHSGTRYALTGTVPAQYSFGSAPPAVLKNIRRIQVTLTTIPARAVPFGPAPKPFTLMASVMPQNLGAADEVTNKTPPSVPTGLAVHDKRNCREKLRVKWNPNPEKDGVDRYRLYYGPTNYVEVSVNTPPPFDKNNPEVTLDPRDLLITKNADRTTAPNIYAIQILAIDSLGNRSEKSAPVAANPAPDVTAFGGGNDTTVNPLKPAAPTGFTVNARADGELDLSWVAPANGSATVGYRLYRSTAPFVTNAHIDGTQQIAGETTLSAGVMSWADEPEVCSESLFVTYYYAVASVNCDETLFDDLGSAGYHTNSSAALSDYAVASGTAQDDIPPPAPGLAGSQPEQLSILLTLTNPPEGESADFHRTEIWWSKVSYPSLSGATVSGGALLPQRESPSSSAGIFRNRGSQVIVFDRESLPEVTPPTPLEAGKTYYLLAVSYDRCGNPSPTARLAFVIPTTTVICAASPSALPSSYFTGARYSSCQPGAVEIGWEYPDRGSVAGFSGFRITRFFADGTKDRELTAAPFSLTSWRDAGPLQEGARYYYEVKATDCLYEQNPLAYPLHASSPYRIPPIGTTISYGQLRRFPLSTGSGHAFDAENFVTSLSDATTPVSYTYHNNVKFFLQNTSGGPLTISRMTVPWNNDAVVLNSVTIGGAPGGMTARTIAAGAAASGVVVPVNVVITDIASGIGVPSRAVPVLLRFTTPTGAVNRLVDMRNEALGVSLWVGDQSAQGAECAIPTRIAIDVPRGPELVSFSQSAPGRDGIASYAVPGPSGTAGKTDIKVNTGIGVNVYGAIVDHARMPCPDGVYRGFDACIPADPSDPSKLRVLGISATAADSGTFPTMPAVGTPFARQLYSVGCDRSIGGDRYAISQTTPAACGALMPQQPESFHWYSALAVDKTGNWDRLPNPDYGNYVYFQQYPINVCDYTPEKPGSVSAVLTEDEASVILTWTAPTVYTDAAPTPVVSDDIITYDVYYKKDSGEWTPAPDGANRSSLRYDHIPPSAGTYHYKVQAKNSCFSCAGTACELCEQDGCCSHCAAESAGVVIP